MRPFVVIAALMSLVLASGPASAIAPLRATDLNGAVHALPADWSDHGGVLILGFSHDARAEMDQWVEALGLRVADANWLETPVIGDVNRMVRPMIRTGMRAHYATPLRRAHVAPVFEDAPHFTDLAGPHAHPIVVLVLNRSGDVVARAEGGAQANVAAIRNALHALEPQRP
jgi:hypothetical protein